MGGSDPDWIRPKVAITQLAPGQSQQILDVKFSEGSDVRLRSGRLVSLSAKQSMGPLDATLAEYPLESISRLFGEPEASIDSSQAAVEARTGRRLPDLNLWFRIKVGPNTNIVDLVNALNALDEVEIAYPASLPAPPPAPVTPNFEPQQGYLDPVAASGIDAKFAWGIPGGTGRNVVVVDIEYGFNTAQEDLPPDIVVIDNILAANNPGIQAHGTAVLGEIVGKNNNLGVKGIAFEATAKFRSECVDNKCDDINIADAVNQAKNATNVGDVILIEAQTNVCGYPNPPTPSQKGYGPVEWEQAVYDAILNATAAGRHVVEPAGNGEVDLDAAGCKGIFNRKNRDSGAIIVGAGAPFGFQKQPARSILSFSSYGSRVDLQGWGENVVTTGDNHEGYYDLFPVKPDTCSAEPNRCYTKTFAGTSSASPIVASAVAILSSVAKTNGRGISPMQMRNLLVATGSSQQPDVAGGPVQKKIGPLPNLRQAIAMEPLPPYGDVDPMSWAAGYINAIRDAGITGGCGNGNYCPQGLVTREQMAAFLVRAVEGEPADNYCGGSSSFSDVSPDVWSCRYIKRLSELNITGGCGGGNYCPQGLVTREQMAVFIVRALEGNPFANYCNGVAPFNDVTAASWSCGHIKRLVDLEITQGCGNGNYCPGNEVNREQMAAFLARAFLGMD